MGDIGGFGQKSAAKSANRQQAAATKGRMKAIRNFGQPANFAQYLKQVTQQLANLYEPARRQSTEAAALGEQYALQDIDTSTGRAGLEGSGIAEWLKAAAKGGRQARTNEALTDYWTNTNQLATQLAKQMQSEIVGGIAGVPMPQYQGIPSAGSAIADLGTNILSMYLFGGGLGGGGKATSAYAAPAGWNPSIPPMTLGANPMAGLSWG